MEARSPQVKSELAVRLKRIEGQVRGVQRMIEEDRDCAEILQQISAIRAALHHASLVVARSYAARCLAGATAAEQDAALDALISALGKLE
ncbi:MAG: metal-sensitive transcriptional regulator [Anaerolineae bacterium]